MITKLIEKLKVKFAGVDDKILERFAKKLAEKVKSDDDADAAVDAVTFQDILNSYGDSRATDATKTAVLNYEKKHGLKDGQKITEPQPTEQKKEDLPDDMPSWAKALIDNNRKLAEQLNKLNTDKIASARKQQLDERIKDLPESLRKGYERITLDTMEDEAFTTLLQEVDTEVQGIKADLNAKGAVFGKPAAGVSTASTGKEASEQEVNAVVDTMNI